MKNIFLIIFLLGFFLSNTTAQIVSADSVSAIDTFQVKHSPRKAVIMSALVPGLGQVYNRKYWKVPIVYASLGTLVYLIGDFNKKYNSYYNAYNDYILELAETPNEGRFNNIQGLQNYTDKKGYLKAYKDFYRRWRDLDVLILAGVYALNIIDANVDAHFFYFDISDNLTLNAKPTIFEHLDKTKNIGISFNLNF